MKFIVSMIMNLFFVSNANEWNWHRKKSSKPKIPWSKQWNACVYVACFVFNWIQIRLQFEFSLSHRIMQVNSIFSCSSKIIRANEHKWKDDTKLIQYNCRWMDGQIEWRVKGSTTERNFRRVFGRLHDFKQRRNLSESRISCERVDVSLNVQKSR